LSDQGRPGQPRPRIRVVAAQAEREGRFLITQRRPEATLPLLWEFPGGRVEEGESDAQALARELREKMGLEIEVGPVLMQVLHAYEGYDLELLLYQVSARGEPRCLRVHDARWVLPEEFGQYEFPGADQRTVDALLGRESG
jgi:8-oxo-dGTP diphosphatase